MFYDEISESLQQFKSKMLRIFANNTPLHCAAKNGKEWVDIVKYYIENGADINAKNDACIN